MRAVVQVMTAAVLMATLGAVQAADLTVRVDAREITRRHLHTDLTLAVKGGPVTLVFPRWIPGEHGPTGPLNTLIGMTMFTGAYDAGASIVGIGNLVTFLQNTAPYRRILRANEYGDLEKDHDALVQLSPTTYIDRVRPPFSSSRAPAIRASSPPSSPWSHWQNAAAEPGWPRCS